MKPYHPLGTVSRGTMNARDLIPAFCEALETAKDCYEWQGMTDRGNAYAEFSNLIADARGIDPDSDIASDIIEALFDALDSFAPPFTYFGAHMGDGSDYGFWPHFDDESLSDAKESGYRVEISDHGNVALYDSNDREIWSIV